MRTSDGADYYANEVIIKLAPGVTDAAARDVLAQVGGSMLADSGPMAALGYRRVALPMSMTADVAISQLGGQAGIAKAERSIIVHTFATPNDARYGELWGMNKIGAPAAWDSGTGSSSILVAVSDTGIDYNHPELAANVWTNPGEIPGNGIDDDGNGYVDDVHGWDFANNDADPMDDMGHGTHVSGTIGAVGNNGAGVAGVNWKVKIQAVKFLNASGSGSLWNGAQTILYAAKMKARVVNASWGCLGPSCYASYLEDALKTLAAAGGMFVAAAGNNANDNDAYPSYPANYAVDNVVAVAATDSNDALASFSDWGATKVHLAAPGVGILSTLPSNQYASWNGTSMATPHVTGAAALFLAARPEAAYAEIKQKLMDTTDKVAGLAGKTVSGGRLNVGRLIASAGHAPATPAGFNAVAGDRNDALLSWNANKESDLSGYRVRWGTGSGVYNQSLDVGASTTTTRVTGLVQGTSYFFVLSALNTQGLASAPSPEKVIVSSDRIAPPQVVDLAASTVPGSTASVELLTSSGEFSSYWAASQAIDGSTDTAWISPGRPESDQESLTLGLYTPYQIDAVELAPNAAYLQFFPVDFDIEVSTDGESWTAVGGLRNATVAAATDRIRIAFPATLAAQVRLHVLRAYQHESGLCYASLAEMTVHEASSAPDALSLTFTAPGDNPGEGRAASYDIRRSSAPLTEATFAAGTAVVTSAPPLSAGLHESIVVSPLAGETSYYFALKATDAAGNRSPMSNVASATTLMIPPSTITDLTPVDMAGPVHPGMVTLTWTAPGADGMAGQAASYDMRVSDVPMTAGNFAAATPVTGLPDPSPAGTAERFVVSDLHPHQAYYFALRAIDAHGAVGAISNVAWAVSTIGNDQTAPAAVDSLSARLSNSSVKITARIDSVSDELSPARAAANLLDGDISTAWMTSAASATTPAWVILDYGSIQPLVRFRANPSSNDLVGSYPQDFEIQTSIDKVNWTAMVHVQGMIGEFAKWNEWSAPVTFARYARLYVTKRGPATGASAYVAMGELETYALTPALDADLTWVAPGDDGYDGTATRYDLRQSTAPITAANFSAATTIPTLQPLHGGYIEVLHLPAVAPESTIYFALKAVDANGNWSGLSNVAKLVTPGIAPAPVSNLAVVAVGTTTVGLTFTATGDDGNIGTATSYDLRYSKTPISPLTWDAATPAPTGAPHPAGTVESFTVAGLSPTTLYYFGIQVLDEVGNRSTLSNIVSATTLDGTPPAAITDLAVSNIDPTQRLPLALTVTDFSGQYSSATPPGNLLDNLATTPWISAGSATVTPAFVTVDLGGARHLGRLRMRAATGYTDLFPSDFKLDVQATPGAAWTTVVAEQGMTTAGAWEEWMLGAVPAVTARLTVTNLKAWNGLLYTALGDLELYEDPADYGRLRLSWTATGDDGAIGTASSYDLRRSPSLITSTTFAASTPVSGVPAPQPAGYLERFDATGLSAETTYCFAVKALDERGNASPVSNSKCATTPGIPPATITDLAVAGVTASSATLTFTAPGADGNVGTAARYEMRRSPTRINTTNWDAATVVDGLPAPHAAGTAERVTVTGLTGLTTYYFAIRAVDTAGNTAAISNNARATTSDNIAPAQVSDLTAATNTAQGGSLLLGWTAPGDNGMGGQAQRYDVRVSLQPINDSNFGAATPVTVGAPGLGGTHETATLTGLYAEQLMYVALKTIDSSGNVSGLSNVAQARTRDEAPAAITDLAIIGGSGQSAGNATLVLQWTAPGDDANVGTAQSYDIRYATTPITASNFAAATPSAPGLAPAAAGTRQQYTVAGLNAGVKYYLAIKTADERGNVSALSNVVNSTTPDEIPPARTIDLTAVTGTTPGTLIVSLTAPGDDAGSGTARSYDLRWSLVALDAGSFDAAATLSAPAPAAGGTRQSFTVSGLPNETLIHLMLRSRDDAGNLSPLSNDASANTPEVPPAAITDLRINGAGTGSLILGWTATGDDGRVGTAVETDLRYALAPITELTFAAGTRVPTAAPGASGTAESATAAGLPSDKTFYFAIKARDDRGNWSPLSNVPSASTQDTVAPGTIHDLVATTGTSAGSIVLKWTATGDDGDTGTAARYDLRRSASVISSANWDAATPIAIPNPRAAGSAESYTVTGLKGESTFHFAIRAIDEAGNTGGLSNDAPGDTAPVAPATVTDLAARLAVAGGAASATLTWTAPGDDGMDGQATGYDLRFAPTPITASTFAAATAIPTSTPKASGSQESVVVAGLAQSTKYYFAVKTVDDTQTWSALSNIATVVVPDLTKPGAPASLVAGVPDNHRKRITGAKTTASSVLNSLASWDSSNLTDADPTSAWASDGSDTVTPEEVKLDLGAVTAIDEIDLTADAKYFGLFPRDFTLSVSADGNNWKTMVTEQSFTVASIEPVTWGFPTESARYVRLSITKTGTSYDKHYAILSGFDVYAAAATDGQAQLTWLAPGDDDFTGKAASYQLYRSPTLFSESTLGTATMVSGTPAPLTAGSLQTMTAKGLAGETVYYWALRAIDAAGNIGPLSAVVSGKTNDVAPAAVRDLAGTPISFTEVTLNWTSTGDDAASGIAASYEIRYLPGTISSHNFADATLVTGLPAPAFSGTAQSVTVHGLTSGVSYHFALVAKDASGNASPLSNVAVVAPDRLPDTQPPAKITDLTLALPPPGGELVPGSASASSSQQAPDFTAAKASDGDRTSFWASSARSASQEEWVRVEYPSNTTSDRLRIWPADGFVDLFPPDFVVRISPDGLSWTTVATKTGFIAVADQPATIEFAASTLRFVEVRATRLARHSSGLYFAALAEIELLTADEPRGTVVASWTSPADDGASGSAASYDFRLAPCPLDPATAPTAPTTTPRGAGEPERIRVPGVAPGSVCAEVSSTDAAGNISPVSNVATIVLP